LKYDTGEEIMGGHEFHDSTVQQFRRINQLLRVNLGLGFIISYITNSLYGAEHYSRGHQLCSQSIVSQHFTETKS
jgi:hypothetical protein